MPPIVTEIWNALLVHPLINLLVLADYFVHDFGLAVVLLLSREEKAERQDQLVWTCLLLRTPLNWMRRPGDMMTLQERYPLEELSYYQRIS